MKKNLLLSLIVAIAFILLIPVNVFAEEYYYIPDHKLETPPLFCAMEFEDERLPTAQSQLMEISKNAVLDWKNKLIESTGEQIGWDFQYRQFTVEEQQGIFFDIDCTVNIYFERQPPKEEWGNLGYADSYLTFSDITIFYLEPIYDYKGKTEVIDGEEWEIAEVTGFKNILDFGLHDTIRHEIGHSLGLDHPKLESYMFSKEGTVYKSPSIMIDEWEYEIDGEIDYRITDYDIRSVINLYGEDGINEINFWTYIDFVIYGIIILVIIYFIRRKFGSKEPELVPLDDEREE